MLPKADPPDSAEVYRQLGVTPTYDHAPPPHHHHLARRRGTGRVNVHELLRRTEHDETAAQADTLREQIEQLTTGFDASKAFHRYEIEWQLGHIRWRVDGVTVQERLPWGPTPIPDQPLEFNVNLWGSESTEFAGSFNDQLLPAVLETASLEARCQTRSANEQMTPGRLSATRPSQAVLRTPRPHPDLGRQLGRHPRGRCERLHRRGRRLGSGAPSSPYRAPRRRRALHQRAAWGRPH